MYTYICVEYMCCTHTHTHTLTYNVKMFQGKHKVTLTSSWLRSSDEVPSEALISIHSSTCRSVSKSEAEPEKTKELIMFRLTGSVPAKSVGLVLLDHSGQLPSFMPLFASINGSANVWITVHSVCQADQRGGRGIGKQDHQAHQQWIIRCLCNPCDFKGFKQVSKKCSIE